jgi:hypothetical protein
MTFWVDVKRVGVGNVVAADVVFIVVPAKPEVKLRMQKTRQFQKDSP